eukprot:PhF_6_TR36474/c0_g1_i4/m.53537/K12811/DDX46, PRP5; ATP-dependent RNA helicase DDX46/PRP5
MGRRRNSRSKRHRSSSSSSSSSSDRSRSKSHHRKSKKNNKDKSKKKDKSSSSTSASTKPVVVVAPTLAAAPPPTIPLPTIPNVQVRIFQPGGGGIVPVAAPPPPQQPSNQDEVTITPVFEAPPPPTPAVSSTLFPFLHLHQQMASDTAVKPPAIERTEEEYLLASDSDDEDDDGYLQDFLNAAHSKIGAQHEHMGHRPENELEHFGLESSEGDGEGEENQVRQDSGDDEGDDIDEPAIDDADEKGFERHKKDTRLMQTVTVRELKKIDHSTIPYEPIKKNLYVESPEIAALSPQEVTEIRKAMDHTKVSGYDVPNPIEHWTQAGLGTSILDALREIGAQVPFPIQRQCIPAILKGRDLVGVGHTGCGKTLAYVLPMLRHVFASSVLEYETRGPIALVMICTRELADQIYRTVLRFTQRMNVSSIVVYGGPKISEDIAKCKRGCKILIGTPGRLTDLLLANKGRVLMMQDCSFVVLDEADRLFDEGFWPQIEGILSQIRPDRQTCLFTATLPKFISRQTKKLLKNPVSVSVGSRIAIPTNVRQSVEVFNSDENRFRRLLQLLGDYVNDGGLVLIFLERKKDVDEMVVRLGKFGYETCRLHSGMDQTEREMNLKDFNRNGTVYSRQVLVTCGLGSRGLDVPNLELVVNYTTPVTMEDYIHRVGRTGRAGKPGTAITFLLRPDEDRHAKYLIHTLMECEQPIPDALREAHSEEYLRRNPDASETPLLITYNPTTSRNAYRGSGFKFDEKESKEARRKRREMVREEMEKAGIVDSMSSSSSSSEGEKDEDESHMETLREIQRSTGMELVVHGGRGGAASNPGQLIEAINKKYAMEEKRMQLGQFRDVLPFNDYSMQVRRKFANRDHFLDVEHETGTKISVRGEYVPPKNKDAKGPRKKEPLHFVVEGNSAEAVHQAITKLQDLIEEMESSVVAQPKAFGTAK